MSSPPRSPLRDLRLLHVRRGATVPMVFAFAVDPRGCDPFEPLTPAQREVVDLLLDGHTNAEIARRRGTSARTVAKQLEGAYRRLGVRSRTELAEKYEAQMRKSS